MKLVRNGDANYLRITVSKLCTLFVFLIFLIFTTSGTSAMSAAFE